jgi:hypothetical protein
MTMPGHRHGTDAAHNDRHGGDEITDTLINFICADSSGCRAHE